MLSSCPLLWYTGTDPLNSFFADSEPNGNTHTYLSLLMLTELAEQIDLKDSNDCSLKAFQFRLSVSAADDPAVI